MSTQYDVAIIGGGPGGSTASTLLKKYNPDLKVVVYERETFPRDHIGESQLPPIGDVLAEMGCWDKVEAANFPIKIGATFRWGTTNDLWDFEFLPLANFKEEARPAKYVGQRRLTAFQVDRAIYDKILLDHAREMGVEVHENTKVTKINRDGDNVTGLVLENGEEITARYYLDASGGVGVLRRAMGVEVTEPTRLQNVAFWDYWENTEWAIEIGVGGTRIQIMSLPYGWMWFIPLGPTRTSVGLVVPAEYYKKSGKSKEKLYEQALREEPRIARLCANGTREGVVRATKDWSFLASRMTGPNWFLVGESAGFADPILSAGLTLTHTGAREAAYTIMELDRGEHDPDWLKTRYGEAQAQRIWQHVRFAEFWYTANGIFTDLKQLTTEIAKDAGLELNAHEAFQWIGTGGFTNDTLGQVGVGGFDLAGVKQLTQQFLDQEVDWELAKCNILRINLEGATKEDVPLLVDGRIRRQASYVRNGKVLPLLGMFKILFDELQGETEIADLEGRLRRRFMVSSPFATIQVGLNQAWQVLETMLNDGWVTGRLSRHKPRLKISTPRRGDLIHENTDEPEVIMQVSD